MSEAKSLDTIEQNKVYKITGFWDDLSDYSEKLHKMGFVKGTAVELAPVQIKDPIVVQIRGSRIALRKHEAKQVLVEII